MCCSARGHCTRKKDRAGGDDDRLSNRPPSTHPHGHPPPRSLLPRALVSPLVLSLTSALLSLLWRFPSCCLDLGPVSCLRVLPFPRAFARAVLEGSGYRRSRALSFAKLPFSLPITLLLIAPGMFPDPFAVTDCWLIRRAIRPLRAARSRLEFAARFSQDVRPRWAPTRMPARPPTSSRSAVR